MNSFSQIAPLDTMVAELPVPTTRELPITDPKPDDTPTPSPHPEPEPEPDNTPTPSPHPEPEPDNTPTPSPHPEAPSNDPIPGPSPIYQEPSDSPDTPPVPGDVPPLPIENPATTVPPETFTDFPSFPSIGNLLRPLLGALGGTLGPALAGLGGLLYPSSLGDGMLSEEQLTDAGVGGTDDDNTGGATQNDGARGPRLDEESARVVEDAIGETTREGVTSNGTIIDSVPDGDAAQANEDFDSMGLSDIQTHQGQRGEVRTGTLPIGSRVTVRPSADGRHTIEITELKPNGRPVRGGSREVRYGSN